MEKQELRIGNLVSDIWSDGKHPFKIMTLGRTKCTYLGSSEFLCIYDNLNPIPLTEGWLIKFGFKKYNDGGELKGDDCFYIHEKSNICIGLTPKFNLSGYRPAKRIIYVHQLQNLYFALTGQELELK